MPIDPEIFAIARTDAMIPAQGMLADAEAFSDLRYCELHFVVSEVERKP